MQPVQSKIMYRDGANIVLTSPTAMPKAGSFLWNPEMMLQMTCRGYATAQFMQPEPTKYSKGPSLEATTFMQPEHPYFAHHSGRFFFVKDRETGALFSAPYEPVRANYDVFEFTALPHAMQWRLEVAGLRIHIELTLPEKGVAELWRFRLENAGNRARKLSAYPVFSFGYLSWMNQSATYSEDLQAIVANYVTPYQKVADYHKQKDFKDQSFLMAEKTPDAWCARLSAFEGEGGLHAPDGILAETLGREGADYELPVAAMQYDLELAAGEVFEANFVFGPCKDNAELEGIRAQYFGERESFDGACVSGQAYVAKETGVLQVCTPDSEFNHYVNHWMARQVYYHGATDRLTTDPQTRNFLQDHMGMCFVNPASMRAAILTALAQQKPCGEMPDGILLHPEATLKYINQVPHADHCVWLPICLRAYLNETGDFALLNEVLPYGDGTNPETVAQHITKAMRWLADNRDERGLSLIAEGDWCDPMNMVGHKGKGVSGWLTLASAYACNEWAAICADVGDGEVAGEMQALAAEFNGAANTHCWDGGWYARGITDDGVAFGVSKDTEGKVYLNPQSWALLSGAASTEKVPSMLAAIDEHLMTPYGAMMLGPAYTGMRADVGRLTQKFPGSAENGSVYNHAAAFYAYSLYKIDEVDRAYDVLRKMLPDEDDCLTRGQLPVYIPNYYRGAYHQYPRTAGRSSQLFNTGTVAWFTRIVTESLFGLVGTKDGLSVQPALPSAWREATALRRFRGAVFNVQYKRVAGLTAQEIYLDGQKLEGAVVANIECGKQYNLEVNLPEV